MKIVEGNLLELALKGKFDIIVHGCNCFCIMGGGIAKQIKATFREAYEADELTVRGDFKKLGTLTHATITRKDYDFKDVTFTVINAYTQHGYGGHSVNLEYGALRCAMKNVVEFAQKMYSFRNNNTPIRIGYPLIGGGLAGGNEDIIKDIINDELDDIEEIKHTLVIWDGK